MKFIRTNIIQKIKIYGFNILRQSALLFLIMFVSQLSRIKAQTQNIRFEQITINDGLSQGSIKAIHQDKQGFLWFGTQDGLNRYDGYSFKIFRKEINNPFSLSNNNIICIDEDKDGNLWIGTADGINKFYVNNYKFQNYTIPLHSKNIQYSNLIYCVHASKTDSNVWFGIREGLCELNPKTGKINKYQQKDWNMTDGHVNRILRFDDNTLIVGISRGTLYKFDIRTKTFHQLIYRSKKQVTPLSNITSLLKDNDNHIWIGTFNGLYKYDLSKNKFWEYHSDPFDKNSILGDVVMDLVLDKGNNIWISVLNSGLSRFNIKSNSFVNFDKESSAFNPKSLISSLLVDKSGILWLGTNGYGIFKLNPYLNNFTHIFKSDKELDIQSIRSFYQDDLNNLWIGGYGGINKLNRTTGRYEYYGDVLTDKNGFTNSSVYVFGEDKEFPGKILWVGTEGGALNKFDIQSGKIDKNPFNNLWDGKKFGMGVYSILDDGEGNLWVGTNMGLVKINKKNYSYNYFQYKADDPTGISPQSISNIYKDSNNQIWIGTDVGGLCLFNKKDNSFRHFSNDSKNPNSLSNNFIKCIYEDSKKRLWIGTNGGGLNLLTDMKKGIFRRITTEDGLPNNVIYGILEDKNGNLWMSSNNGICKYNFEKNLFLYFDVRDGLQSNEFNTNAYYKTKNGEMFFGGVNGFNSFIPNKFFVNNNYPKIVLTNFELFNKKVDTGEKINNRILLNNSIGFTKQIELKYAENVFSIEFASLDYSAPLKNKYSYFLEGFDKHWTYPSENRKATYTNLHPGKYIFKVKGTNNDQLWSIRPAELTIIVIPPFWQTWWFITMNVIVFFAIIVLIYLQRVKTIEQQKKLLEKEVYARTADLAKLNEDLKNSEDELKELNSDKDKFFSILAHDLRGPFGGVIGLSEILVEDIDELDKKAIKDLSYDINQLLHEQYILLENLLDWSRLQLNKYQFDPESINLSEIANRMYRFLLNNAKAKGVNISSDIREGIYVLGNATMLLSVVQNLISNAIKFTKESGEIKISLFVNGKDAVITFEDNGVGMDKKTMEKLFISDILKSTEGTAQERGSGIGLMLVNEFVSRMSGTIKVESKLNVGTKFIIHLPLSDETNNS